jgi:hypothetical protein
MTDTRIGGFDVFGSTSGLCEGAPVVGDAALGGRRRVAPFPWSGRVPTDAPSGISIH